MQPGSTAIKKEKAVNEYFCAPYADIMSEGRWGKHDTSALMGAAHFIFRHSILDRLVFAIGNEVCPVQLSPRSEFPQVPKRFREVCQIPCPCPSILYLLVHCDNKRLGQADSEGPGISWFSKHGLSSRSSYIFHWASSQPKHRPAAPHQDSEVPWRWARANVGHQSQNPLAQL